MKIKQVNKLAEIISQVQDGIERARLTQFIGLVCAEGREEAFDWTFWNNACKQKEQRG